MKYKIIDIYEFQDQLRVVVEHEYGQENIGLSLDAKYLDDTGQPRWKSEVRDLLIKKYGDRKKDRSLPRKQLFKSEIGKEITI